MIAEALNLLKTALVLLAFLQANPTLATPAFRENAFQTAYQAISYAQTVVGSGSVVSGGGGGSAGSSSSSSGSSGSSGSGGVTPPAAPQAVSFTLNRPFQYEVVPMQLTSFPVVISATNSLTATVRVSHSVTGAELYNKTVALVKGDNTLQIPLSNTNAWKGGWLSVKVTQDNRMDNYKSTLFGVGFLFLTAGQSNAANWECSLCTSVPQSRSGMVSFLSDPAVTNSSSSFTPSIQLKSLSFVTNTTKSPLSDGPHTNVWLSLGEKIVEEYNVPVAFIAVGQGGASVAQWNSNLKPLFGYGKEFTRINGVLWHQGETDTIGTTPKDTYRDTLLEIIQNVRADYGYDVPWMIANATFCNVSNSYREITIRQAQQEVVTYGLKATYLGPDTDAISHVCHFDTLEQLQNYANAWWNVLKTGGLLDVNTSYLVDYLKH